MMVIQAEEREIAISRRRCRHKSGTAEEIPLGCFGGKAGVDCRDQWSHVAGRKK